MASLIADYPKTGIKVLIVGAGFGGLTAAIECHLKGHDVVVLEKTRKGEQLGDIISISPNAGRVLTRWDPKMVAERLEALCMHHSLFRIHTHAGDYVVDQPKIPMTKHNPMYNGHRSDFHKVFLQYAESLGIPIHTGKHVNSYSEDPVAGEAWVTTDEGEVFRGHVVIGADGVGSKARELALGFHDKPKSSGYAIYRAWFSAQEAGVDTDPLTREFVVNGDTHNGWIGKDMHLLLATCKGGREVSWVCTHKDDYNIDGSWSSPGDITEALKVIEGWDPRCRAIVKKTPSCVDWKLVDREPLPTWVTGSGLTCLLGDAAHPFLPTSIQGCSQAIEDGAFLATCLALSHADESVPSQSKVPTALRTYQRLRYERVKAAQKNGKEVLEMWHNADWSKVRQNPETMRLPRPDWLLLHDCERFARRMWRPAMVELAGGESIPTRSLAAGPDSDEFAIAVADTDLPPTPVTTPKEEVERQFG